LTPADSGWTSIGSLTRCPASPSSRYSTAAEAADDRLRALGERHQRNVLDLLLGQDLVPPADPADQCERQPHDADDHVRDERCADQGEAERNHMGHTVGAGSAWESGPDLFIDR